MGLYECILYEKPQYGDPRPVICEGQIVSRELVADTASKARYSYWRDLVEVWQEVKLQNIRVRSLNRKPASPMAYGWEGRIETANAIIRIVASHGRRFFSENSDRREDRRVDNPFVAHFQVDRNGELWYVDRYTRKGILVRHREWPRFTDGGTLRAIVEHLASHIKQGTPVNHGYFGVSPDWMPNHWGYGEDMLKVRDEVGELLGVRQLSDESFGASRLANRTINDEALQREPVGDLPLVGRDGR